MQKSIEYFRENNGIIIGQGRDFLALFAKKIYFKEMSQHRKYICIHGHFYQPTRENPWLEEVEVQDSAYPFHDWNEKISKECYSVNISSPILDSKKRVIERLNNYTRISFNFGSTLLSWLEKNEPKTYKEIIKSDKESKKYFSGHGSALAQCYNHLIMPLANSQDKKTQVAWGISDFEYRFKRKPEGMWLPETAVDLDTLELLAQGGIKFTILAPHQAKAVRKIGEKEWQSTDKDKIDLKMPYLCRLPSKKSLVIFFYNHDISNEISFGNLLKNGENLTKRLLSGFRKEEGRPHLVHIATDGENYGHHHSFGNMALAYCLKKLEQDPAVKITIYGEYLDKFSPSHEVLILENTSWSCSHGIERWRGNCGCSSGMNPTWKQTWREPLREATSWLTVKLAQIYEKEMSTFTADPWDLRNNYIEVILNRTIRNIEHFLATRVKKNLTAIDKSNIIKLLEMQRHQMLMQTSCGWFFDDISGVENIQIMRHAGRAMQLAAEFTKIHLEEEYLSFLKKAKSNNALIKNGAKTYLAFVRPSIFITKKVKRLFEYTPEYLNLEDKK